MAGSGEGTEAHRPATHMSQGEHRMPIHMTLKSRRRITQNAPVNTAEGKQGEGQAEAAGQPQIGAKQERGRGSAENAGGQAGREPHRTPGRQRRK